MHNSRASSSAAVASALLLRDLRLAVRQPGLWALPLLFYLLAALLMTFGIGAVPTLLRATGPGVIWICALLAAMLAHAGMFRSERADGTLDLQLLSRYPLALLVAARIAALWLVTGLPAAIAALLLGAMFGLPAAASLMLMVSLLLGTPTVSLLGALGASLTLGAGRSSMLPALLVLPMCIPVIVFASAAVGATVAGLPATGHLLVLTAMLVLAATLVPFAAAACLRAAGGAA